MKQLHPSRFVRIRARDTVASPTCVGVAVTMLIAACGRAPAAVQPSDNGIAIVARTAPEHPYVETTTSGKTINFQLRVHNGEPRAVRVARYMVSIYDSGHRLVMSKEVDTNAFAPSIAVLGSGLLAAGETTDFFNPLSDFDADVPLDALTVSLCIRREGTEAERERNRHRLVSDCDNTTAVDVTPAVQRREIGLELPLHGRITVWDGHDSLPPHARPSR